MQPYDRWNHDSNGETEEFEVKQWVRVCVLCVFVCLLNIIMIKSCTNEQNAIEKRAHWSRSDRLGLYACVCLVPEVVRNLMTKYFRNIF